MSRISIGRFRLRWGGPEAGGSDNREGESQRAMLSVTTFWSFSFEFSAFRFVTPNRNVTFRLALGELFSKCLCFFLKRVRFTPLQPRGREIRGRGVFSCPLGETTGSVLRLSESVSRKTNPRQCACGPTRTTAPESDRLQARKTDKVAAEARCNSIREMRATIQLKFTAKAGEYRRGIVVEHAVCGVSRNSTWLQRSCQK